MLPTLLDHFTGLPAFRALARSLPGTAQVASVSGLAGSSGAVLAAGLARLHPQRMFVVAAPTPAAAERWFADLGTLMERRVALYPQREALGEEEPHVEIAGERAETIDALSRGEVQVLVTTLRATAERTRMPALVLERRLEIRLRDTVTPGAAVARLEAMGYERVPSVLDVGQFAVRGGIVDVYGFGMAAPARIEWWGDEVLSIRSFDLDTQRSEGTSEVVRILPLKPAQASDEDAGREASGGLLDVLPTDVLVLVDPDVEYADVERMWSEAEHHVEIARRRGEEVPGREALLLAPGEWSAVWSRLPRLEIRTGAADHTLGCGPPPAIERKVGRLARLAGAVPTLVLCDNEGQLERLDEILSGESGDAASSVTLALGSLGGGFTVPGLTVLTDHEIFLRARRLRRPRRYREAHGGGAGALRPGAYVVHLEHGIGIYRGVETITVGDGTTIEVAVLEYEGNARLNVPLYRLDQLEPYRSVGDDGQAPPPKLHRLGGTRWRQQREKVEAAIRELAAELLELYARRSVTPGYAFPPDTRWQRELESSFLYDDTPDQRTATDETKRDMERPRPMDRLIVGDVGYGKTEVAVRAAFKAVQAGKQVAVLVPTTILAEQHGRTFGERLADYPVRIDVLSRFRTPAEQRTVIKGVREGAVDVVIGTHRLLSSDVTFKDLGLLIVDEEHRFGVRHKERLKALRLEVDVLTLTATPIPRTLHLALSGLRDMTLIETPPRDRSPVLTFIEPWDDGLIEEAVAREVDRGGQVFFVHNRIETIATIAERVRALAPRALVAVAHGKMRERDLDEVMRRFVAGEVQVLVSTMIVESGLDVPNANTMLIHQAHQFGLAQLYQLRGRVGRGHRRAYCYLIVPDAIDEEADRRLKVLEHHTDLGSGYRIAVRDLELRGAGNLLGSEQSGHAHAVGVDLYLRWLHETVRALKGEGVVARWSPTEVTLDGPAYLPDVFVPDEDAKLEFYRRLARAGTADEIAALRDELRDRFGPIPPEAEGLLVASELRALGTRIGLESIALRGDDARLRFRTDAAPRLMRLRAALDEVQFAADVRQTVPLALRLRRLGGLETGRGLVRALSTVVAESKGAESR